MDDRRGAARWELVLPVRYLIHPSYKEGYGHTRNLSTMGAQLENVERHASGDVIDLMFSTGEGSENSIRVEGRVVWQVPAADSYQECNFLTGIEFTKIQDRFKKKILDYVMETKPEQVRARWWGDWK